MKEQANEDNPFMNKLIGKEMEMTQKDVLDEESGRMVERFVILRLSTKHVN